MIKQHETDCHALIGQIKSKVSIAHESQTQKHLRKIGELNIKVMNTSNELKQRIEEYEARESRPEDVARIQEL